MRAPPPVSVELGDERAWRWAQRLVWSAALGVGVAWAGAHGEIAAPAVGLALGAAVIVALRRAGFFSGSGPVRLTFDGVAWACDLRSGGLGPQACSVRVALDLGGWMLLRIDIDPPSRASRPAAALPWGRAGRWCAASPRLAGAAWQALRIALYCAEQGHKGQAGSRWPVE